MPAAYRSRLAPSPTGFLHLGHARTFYIAWQRAQLRSGQLILRMEDLDRARCRLEFENEILVDLKELGLTWQEGPDVGGQHAPYRQSERLNLYLEAWKRLHATNMIYPCTLSRKDVAHALSAPHGTEEAVFPAQLRPPLEAGRQARAPGGTNWRFRAPEGQAIQFQDGCAGLQSFTAGRDFGDFLVWRKDGFPSYELAVVVDDAAMQITEVVRGQDLLLSTARQILLYEALGFSIPEFYHTKLVLGEGGTRLAKRDGAGRIKNFVQARGKEALEDFLMSGKLALPAVS